MRPLYFSPIKRCSLPYYCGLIAQGKTISFDCFPLSSTVMLMGLNLAYNSLSDPCFRLCFQCIYKFENYVFVIAEILQAIA
jgi:hypothetical protein